MPPFIYSHKVFGEGRYSLIIFPGLHEKWRAGEDEILEFGEGFIIHHKCHKRVHLKTAPQKIVHRYLVDHGPFALLNEANFPAVYIRAKARRAAVLSGGKTTSNNSETLQNPARLVKIYKL